MLLDFENSMLNDGFLAFPTWPYAVLPKQPGAIKDTTVMTGTGAGASINIQGSVSQVNQGMPSPPFPGS